MKILKILLVNIICIFILLFCIEIIFSAKWSGFSIHTFGNWKKAVFNTISAEKYMHNLLNYIDVEGAFSSKFRDKENLKSSKKPIILSGCSFTWGDGLEDNETFSYQLANYTDRPVYNVSGRGWGLNQLLYLSELDEFYSTYPQPEFLIYTFIDDHLCRINKFKIEPLCIDFQPRYEYKNNEFKELKPSVLDRLVSVEYHQFKTACGADKEIVYDFFKTIKNRINSHWKDTKFIVLKYPTNRNEAVVFNNKKLWKDIENLGIIVVELEEISGVDLCDEKYKVDGWHPTASAWENIVPNLSKKLNL